MGMELFQGQDQGLCQAFSLHLRLPGIILEPVASAIWSSWSILVVILLISKEVQSSTRGAFWLCPNNIVIMAPYVLTTIPNSFHLSLHQVIALS